MDAEKPSARAIRYAKRQKRNDEEPPNPAGGAAVEQTGDIFKLDIDCYEEAFDYLLFEDLVNVGKTCKRLQGVAGYCYQQNHSRSTTSNSDGIRCKGVDVKHFVPFIRNIQTNADGLRYILDVCTQLRRLKEIRICVLNSVYMNRLKDIPMPNLEGLCVISCDLATNFHGIIEHCPKLKRLVIDDCKGDFNWLDRKYPTLESFDFCPLHSESIEGIPKFLELNTDIREFSTSQEVLLENQNEFMSSNIKLDDLKIIAYGLYDDEFQLMCNLLNALHERRFYKELQMVAPISQQEEIDQLSAVNGLVRLNIGCDTSGYPFTFSALKNLKKISWFYSKYVADLEMMAKDLSNLKYIGFDEASIDETVPFIRQSVEMREISVDRLYPGDYYDDGTNVIDLMALNKERGGLPNAAKITLYVKDDIYLATKWALGETNFGLIRLRRVESLL